MIYGAIDNEGREWQVYSHADGRVSLTTSGFSYSYLAESRFGQEYDVDVDIDVTVTSGYGDIDIDGVSSDGEWEMISEEAEVGWAIEVAEALAEMGIAGR